VVVTGFGHRSEAPLMEPPRRESRRGADQDRLTHSRRREPPPKPAQGAAKPAPGADPIFTKPYEPGQPAAPAAKPAAAPQKRERQVAALLGGFVRKPG
jgi:hypothetical protein